jgi:hypothetical protein
MTTITRHGLVMNMEKMKMIRVEQFLYMIKTLLVGNQLLWVGKEDAEEKRAKRAKRAVRREEGLAGADKQIFYAIFVYNLKTC